MASRRARKQKISAVAVMRTILERIIGKQRNFFVCIIDHEKAFNIVGHVQSMRILEDLDIDRKEMREI